MPEAAKLGADNFVPSDFGGGKVHVHIKAGHKVLLDAQLGNIEGVPHILGVHQEMNFAIDGNSHFGCNNVVLRIGVVSGVEAEEVGIGLADLVSVDGAEGAIGSGIAEVKGELSGLRLDGDGVGRGWGGIDAAPGLGAENSES